ncbi:extracellular solute-binding protein [Treponema parvum]|uniref:Extracellular solute-binding protein n=1 Tax=Treponema parvum TaxID=138851 RepID=A0A975EY45_9SPIR|nr:extracellular solute-binding protein [Treponema parvum]QTQ11076.1 extracellular solute-binding protein [Treponema parvum]
MKRLAFALFVLFVIIAPIFAGGAKEKSVDGGMEVITLKISHNMDFITIPEAVVGAAERLNAKYETEGKNIRIKFEKDYQTIDWTEYQNNIVFAHKVNDAPDFYAIADPASLIKAGLLLDITSFVKENQDVFTMAAFDGVTVDGKVYAYPPDLPTRVIYYSKEDLVKIGWTNYEIEALPSRVASGEFTLEDFIALCNEVVEKGGARYGLEHRPGRGPDFLDVMKALGCEYYTANGELVFDSEGLTRFFKFTYDNANITKITPNNLNQMGWSTINQHVGTGEAFAYYGPIFSVGYVASAVKLSNEKIAEKEAFILFPKSRYTNGPFTVAAPQYIGISADTKYPEICLDILAELSNDSSDLLALHGAKINSLLAVKDANKNEKVLANPIVGKVTYMSDYAITVPSVNGLNTFLGELFKQIVALELGETTPEKALADLKTQTALNIKNVIYK